MKFRIQLMNAVRGGRADQAYQQLILNGCIKRVGVVCVFPLAFARVQNARQEYSL